MKIGRSIGIGIVVATIGLSLACDKIKTGNKVELKTQKQKLGYTLGQQIGQNMSKDGIEVDADTVAAGIKDSLTGKEPRMSEDERRQTMMKMQEEMVAKLREKQAKGQEEGAKYLAENKKKEGVKVTESGLQYRVVEAGKGKTPTKSDKVRVHYRGKLTNGEVFDSSYDRGQPAEFPVNGVIPGWTEALQLMKEGAKWELVIPSDLAYGSRAMAKIPPNSVLIFDVELLKIL